MRDMNMLGRQRRSKYRSYKGTVGKIAENLLNRDFKTEKPFEKLATDVTEFNVCNQKVYLSPVLDLFSSEILSYSIRESPNFAQTRTMMNGLFAVLPRDATPILHSDQGRQYQMREYQQMLKDHGITQSMSRKVNC